MPRTSLHTLSWSPDHACYELSTQGRLERTFALEDTEEWLVWLGSVTSFAFRGAAGRLSVYQETRRDASHYWYAYSTTGNRTHKRYLGHTASVTFARLEEVALALNHAVSAPSASASPITPSQDGMPDLAEQDRDRANWQEMLSDLSLPVTRFVPPLLPAEPVIREALLTRLDAARTHQLTLLSASAGWGKTTLLAQWAARARFPVVWFSLDALENDPARFWTSVVAALRYHRAYPFPVGERALEMLRSAQGISLETILTTLVNELSAPITPVFLLLDDYHVIAEQAIHASLLFLLEHLPAHLHLIIASRTDPPLSLARLRARGALLELRDADLRFQEDEAADFLTRTMVLSLEPAEITQLIQRTEGWIAGLHLAALALPRHADHAAFVRGFTGSHRYLLDYVREDILARVAQPLQDFVLQCAILGRMSAALCQMVTGQANLQTSQQMLEALERANLFLVPLDEERHWYRLHDLFREALLARLHATQPELVPLLHRRAASFYETQGAWSEAITHLLAAQDYASAVAVMEQKIEQFWLRGETATLFHWITDLPDEALRAHAGFALKVAGYLLNASFAAPKAQIDAARAQVERLLLRVEEVVRWAEGAQQDQVRLLPQRLSLLRLMGEVEASLVEAGIQQDRARFLSLVQQIMQMDKDDELFWQVMVLGFAFLYYYAFLQEGARLLPRLLEVRQQASQSGERFALLKVKQWVAMTAAQAGQLRLVHRESLEALALLEHMQGYALLRGYFLTCLAEVFFAWNHLDEARLRLHQVIEDATAWQQIDLLEWAYVRLAELEITAGNLAEAAQVFYEELPRLPGEIGNLAFRRTCLQVRLWLAQGNLAEAASWAEQAMFRHVDTNPTQRDGVMALLLVAFAGQHYDQALAVLEKFRSLLDRPGSVEDTITFLSFYAVALHQTGRHAQAREAVLRLLALTESEGYLRAYLDMGEPMQQLLQSLLDAPQEEASPVPGSYIATLLAAFREEAQKQAERSVAQQPGPEAHIVSATNLPGPVSEQTMLLETLTPQELRVLRLLATGRSNQEIAQELVVSLNTVKTHVKNLYSKLQVSSRAQALALARDLQVL